MRGCWSIVALVGFVMQQFVCCAAACACDASTNSEQAPPIQACCHHHHHAPEQPAEPVSSHHLCVATHLFFIERVAVAEIDPLAGPILAAALPLDPLAVIELREPQVRGSITEHSWSPPALARRAALGVWTL